MGNPEKTERRILAWFSISFSYLVKIVSVTFRDYIVTTYANYDDGLYTSVSNLVNSIFSLAR